MGEQRFIDIETKISHQEFLIEQLHEVVYKQQGTIDQLEATLKTLIKRFQETLDGGAGINSGNEKPPHY